MARWPIVPVVAISALALASPTRACSVVSGYQVPSTIELVESADTIVLAKVRAGAVDAKTGFKLAYLNPVALLKGAELPPDVRLDYAVLSNDQIRAVASDPRNLVDANPDAFSGSCNRAVFDEGMTLVVFLRREGGKFMVHDPPFSRALEDVASENALWVKAVKLYVQVTALPRPKRRAAMRHEQERLSMEIDDPDSRLLALELNRALHEKR